MTVPAGKTVTLDTNMGTIRIALAPDMPITAGNFETLVQKGYYNGVIFHRVIDGFMIQGGDPTGTGRGGPGDAIKDEFTPGNRNDRGTISMANAGPEHRGVTIFHQPHQQQFPRWQASGLRQGGRRDGCGRQDRQNENRSW